MLKEINKTDGYQEGYQLILLVEMQKDNADIQLQFYLESLHIIPFHIRFLIMLSWMNMSLVQAYAAAGTLNQNYANILLLLLRLRQACDHPLLVKGFTSDSVGRDSMDMAKNLPRNMLIKLMKHLENSTICLKCGVSYPDFCLFYFFSSYISCSMNRSLCLSAFISFFSFSILHY